MQIVQFVPGAIVTPNPITLPASAPDIDVVVSAQIVRLPAGLADHDPADIVAAIAAHAVHAHDMQSTGQAGAPTQALGTNAGIDELQDDGAAAVHTIPGGVAGLGIQDDGAAVHAGSAVPVAHAGGNPVVAAVPTRLTTRTISLNVDTLVGDVLSLDYIEVGERVLVS